MSVLIVVSCACLGLLIDKIWVWARIPRYVRWCGKNTKMPGWSYSVQQGDSLVWRRFKPSPRLGRDDA